MNGTETTKRILDYAALGSGTTGSLAQYSDWAGQLTPILSFAFVLLSIAWLLWRMVDRLRFGPRRDEE